MTILCFCLKQRPGRNLLIRKFCLTTSKCVRNRDYGGPSSIQKRPQFLKILIHQCCIISSSHFCIMILQHRLQACMQIFCTQNVYVIKSFQLQHSQLHNYVDPNALGLSLFESPGYFSKIASYVIYVVKCKPTEVTIKLTPAFYNELPVLHNGKAKFMTGRSKLLVEDAAEIAFDDTFQPKFYLNNVWYSKSGLKNLLQPTVGRSNITKELQQTEFTQNLTQKAIENP